MDEIVIHVQTHSEEGFEFSIYANMDDAENQLPIDGGFFDGSFKEAVDEAVSIAKGIISTRKVTE